MTAGHAACRIEAPLETGDVGLCLATAGWEKKKGSAQLQRDDRGGKAVPIPERRNLRVRSARHQAEVGGLATKRKKGEESPSAHGGAPRSAMKKGGIVAILQNPEKSSSLPSPWGEGKKESAESPITSSLIQWGSPAPLSLSREKNGSQPSLIGRLRPAINPIVSERKEKGTR